MKTTPFLLYGICLFCITGYAHTDDKEHRFQASGKRSKTDIISIQAQYKREADRWGLSLDEWGKYLEIKKGPRGTWSPNLDPLAMLALEADSEDEMKHYAVLYAQMQDLRIQQELRVDRYRREAVQRLYSEKNTFDKKLLNSNHHQLSKMYGQKYAMSPVSRPTDMLMLGDRLLYFASVSTKPLAFIKRLTKKMGKSTGVTLDIFVMGADSDKEIMEWANSVGVNTPLLKKKLITLNHDKGRLKQLSSDHAGSQVFLQRGEVIYRVREAIL